LPREKGHGANRLKEQGWVKQNTIDEPRLSECVELYKSLGYEVHLEPATPSEFEECGKCYDFEDETATVKTIYIRPKKRKLIVSLRSQHSTS
jgi:hypothetical protein